MWGKIGTMVLEFLFKKVFAYLSKMVRWKKIDDETGSEANEVENITSKIYALEDQNEDYEVQSQHDPVRSDYFSLKIKENLDKIKELEIDLRKATRRQSVSN